MMDDETMEWTPYDSETHSVANAGGANTCCSRMNSSQVRKKAK